MAESSSHRNSSAVALRPVSATDLPIFFEHQFDPISTRMAAFPARDRESFMAHWSKILLDSTNLLRTIEVGKTVVGNVLSFDRDGKRLIGYWVGREHWGKGYASAALADFLRIESVRPLHAYVAKHNLGSIRVLRRCGFMICGESKGPGETPGVEVEDFLMELPRP